MTLNQVIARIKVIAESHKKVNHFFFGDVADWMSNEPHLEFPSVRLEINTFRNTQGGIILDCMMVLCDLCLETPEDVNDESLKANDVEVQSDMLTVANDILSVINHPDLEDWLLQETPQGEIFGKHEFGESEHVVAGVMFEFQLLLPQGRDYCQVPIDGILQENSAFILTERNQVITEEA